MELKKLSMNDTIFLENNTTHVQNVFGRNEKLHYLWLDVLDWYRHHGISFTRTSIYKIISRMSSLLGHKPNYYANYEYKTAVWGLEWRGKQFLIYLSKRGGPEVFITPSFGLNELEEFLIELKNTLYTIPIHQKETGVYGKIIVSVIPVIDYSVRKLCTKPYHGHPKGCPNFNKKPSCPPLAPYFDQVYDLTKPIFAICNVFDFKGHVEKMRAKHSNWSERQLRCVLYWQNSARKQLKRHIIEFLRQHRGYRVEPCPEAMGVNVTETMKNAGVILEWPPENVVYQIALVGVHLKEECL